MPRKPAQIAGVFEKVPGSGVWYIRYRLKPEDGGKLIRKRMGSRQAAIEELDRAKRIRTTGRGRLAKSAKEQSLTEEELRDQHLGLTVGQLCDQYERHLLSEDNPERPQDVINPPARLKTIKARFGHRVASSLSPIEIKDWLKTLGKSAGTLNRLKSTLSAAYAYGVERELVPNNPARMTRQFKVKVAAPRWLRDEEEDRIRAVLQRWIDQCPEHHRLTKLYLEVHPIALTVALWTGLRKGNQFKNLYWSNIDFESGTMLLPTTKSGKPHYIKISPYLERNLRRLQAIHEEINIIKATNDKSSSPGEHKRTQSKRKYKPRMVSDDRVFNISEPREWWAKALKEAGLADSGLVWHSLRHTAATRMAMGNDIQAVQAAMGHGSIAMTMRYVSVAEDAKRQTFASLDRWAK